MTCDHDWHHAKAICLKCGVLAMAKGTRYVAIKCNLCPADAVAMVDNGDFRCAECKTAGDGARWASEHAQGLAAGADEPLEDRITDALSVPQTRRKRRPIRR